MLRKRMMQKIINYCNGCKFTVTILIIHNQFHLLDDLLGKNEIELDDDIDNSELIYLIISGIESNNYENHTITADPTILNYLAKHNLINIGKLIKENFLFFEDLPYIFDNLILIKYLCKCGLCLNYTPNDREYYDMLDACAEYGSLDVYKYIEKKLDRNIDCCTILNALYNKNYDVFLYVLNKFPKMLVGVILSI